MQYSGLLWYLWQRRHSQISSVAVDEMMPTWPQDISNHHNIEGNSAHYNRCQMNWFFDKAISPSNKQRNSTSTKEHTPELHGVRFTILNGLYYLSSVWWITQVVSSQHRRPALQERLYSISIAWSLTQSVRCFRFDHCICLKLLLIVPLYVTIWCVIVG